MAERLGNEFQTVGDLVNHVLATLNHAAVAEPKPGA